MSDRPVECGQCKRPIKIMYKEVAMQSITCTKMCADCPVFQQKLHGSPGEKTAEELPCNCGTTFESVKIGGPLGCSECYVTFENFLVRELLAADGIPAPLQKQPSFQSHQVIHVGKTPDQPINTTLSNRMTSLNEALHEALKKENYEQAAWLRDQIKKLKEEKT